MQQNVIFSIFLLVQKQYKFRYKSSNMKRNQKIFTEKTEDEALYKLYQFKDNIKRNGLPKNFLQKTMVTIYTLGCKMEEIKKSRGKIGTNTYRTNISTLKRIST